MSLFTSIPFIKSRLNVPKQIVSNSWDRLEVILRNEVNLFCWKRPIDNTISSYLENLIESDLKSIKFHSNIDSVHQKIEEERLSWGQQYDEGANLFWEDVSRVTTDFLHFSEDKSGTILLKIIDHNACTKFHTDGYSLRLFTTYYGKGTEWLPERATNRNGLRKTNGIIVKDKAQIQHMEPIEVGILKGELPNRSTSVKGIVHKSPEIKSRKEKRIILRVDI